MVGIFDCGGVLGKYEIRLKERKVVNMEALNTYKTEKTLAEQMNERLAEMKMTKAEAALKMNYSRAALSQYLNGKYASDPTELEKKVREFLAATGGVAEGQEPENSVPTGAGTLKKKVEFFESRDFVQTIGVCQACQEYMGLGIIVGKSGQGKTHALKKYAELPRVAYIECDDTMACRDLVEAIENGIGLPMTEEGELFYEDEEGDASYGWSLLDFMQGEYDDFTQMEIQQRIRSKMSKRDYIDAGSIQTTVNFDGHIYHIRIAFRRTDSNSEYNIDIESNGVEVIVE